MTTIGYARVSSADQNHDGQVERLKAAGCTKVFSEKVSGIRPYGSGTEVCLRHFPDRRCGRSPERR